MDRRRPIVASRLLSVLAFATARNDGPLVARAQLQRIEAIVRDVAAKGRDAEANDLLDVLRRMGDDATALAKLRDDAATALAAVSSPARDVALSAAAHGLHAIASELAKDLGALGEAPRRELAGLILRLDDDLPAAHQALGHALKDGAWTSEESLRRDARSAEIEAAAARARALDVPLVTEPSTFAPLAAVDPAPATAVRWGPLLFVSTWEAPRLERIVRGMLRAAALSEFVRGRPLAVPEGLANEPQTYVLLHEREKYRRSIDRAAQYGGTTAARAALLRDRGGYRDEHGFFVVMSVGEIGATRILVQKLADAWLPPGAQPCLVAGHANWLCLTLFGARIPGTLLDPGAGGDAGRTLARPRDTPEERLARRLATAGLAGARRWLVFKAAHREDPAWTNSFVDDVAKLVDLDLLKSTFVTEYLHESGALETLMRRTAMHEDDTCSRQELIASQIPDGLPAFEERFRAWLLPSGGAVAQRLQRAAQPTDKPSPDEAALLADLDRVRRAAWVEKSFGPFAPVDLDRELSINCARHVAYLKRHRAQLEKWPDAHEEYVDQEAFSAGGCWAGMHAVIAPGVTRAEDAIDGWMATFFHRVPLLDPGLKRVGFGLGDSIAVLDALSLVDPDGPPGLVLWPPPDRTGVPTRFEPELPNPVPGQDERQFGYPITLQAFNEERSFPAMKLVRGGKPEGAEVACWFSSPANPTNLDCSPPGAWCLIPKAPLDAGTKYTVVAAGSDGKSVVWSFTTGQ